MKKNDIVAVAYSATLNYLSWAVAEHLATEREFKTLRRLVRSNGTCPHLDRTLFGSRHAWLGDKLQNRSVRIRQRIRIRRERSRAQHLLFKEGAES